MSVLLDTNIVSEMMKAAPNAEVLAFVSESRSAWISVITAHELDYGVARLPTGRKRAILEAALADLYTRYEDRVLPVRYEEARQAALLRAESHERGRALHLADALIAATAKAHGLTVATRNISDFEDLGVHVIDPWTPGR